ncbi:PTS glucose transporter subunit IIA [Alishewanella longhuensis]
MSYSEIIWQQDWTKLQGFIVKSPCTGQLMPISEHPQPLYYQAILPNTLSCKLQHGTIYTPFNAEFSTARDVDRRLIFKHQSGLSLTLDLPVALRTLQGKGMHWLSRSGQQLTAGTPVLQLDLPYLQLLLDDIYCLATIAGSARLDKIYSRKAQVNANEDALFVLQLKTSSKE